MVLQVMSQYHNFMHRQVLLLRACTEPMTPADTERLHRHGLRASALGNGVLGNEQLPDWVQKWASYTLEFVELEKQRLPQVRSAAGITGTELVQQSLQLSTLLFVCMQHGIASQVTCLMLTSTNNCHHACLKHNPPCHHCLSIIMAMRCAEALPPTHVAAAATGSVIAATTTHIHTGECYTSSCWCGCQSSTKHCHHTG